MLRTDAHGARMAPRHAEVAKAPRPGRTRWTERRKGLAWRPKNIDLRGRRGGSRANYREEEAVDVLRVIDDRMQSACGRRTGRGSARGTVTITTPCMKSDALSARYPPRKV